MSVGHEGLAHLLPDFIEEACDEYSDILRAKTLDFGPFSLFFRGAMSYICLKI
jgi:hypothetical protein